MSTSNQQTLTDSGANERPPMLKKGNYIPWESSPIIPNPDKPSEQILKPLSKMTEGNKKQYIADVRHSRLMDEFDKFSAKEGESLESVYERLTTLMNIMDRNNVHPIPVNDERNQIVQCVPQNESNPGNANVQCYNCNEKGHYARDCQKPRVRDAKYFREQILLAMKDEAGSNLKDEENDFMLDNSYRDETLEESTAAAISEVNSSTRDHEQVNRVKIKTIIHTSANDQIDLNIIFNDPYVENNGGTSEHDSTAHDEYNDIKMLAYNVQREAENQKRLNNDLKRQKTVATKGA
ncbi:retrovirus-related pol polyprotein from transposon TNT 1-94 [Tanacetum coccineum]